MGRDFSGSCTVTSRNSLLHKGATKSTYSERLDPEVVSECRRRELAAVIDGTLATANFGEYPSVLKKWLSSLSAAQESPKTRPKRYENVVLGPEPGTPERGRRGFSTGWGILRSPYPASRITAPPDRVRGPSS